MIKLTNHRFYVLRGDNLLGEVGSYAEMVKVLTGANNDALSLTAFKDANGMSWLQLSLNGKPFGALYEADMTTDFIHQKEIGRLMRHYGCRYVKGDEFIPRPEK